MGKIIAVANNKGGVLKTSMTVNLAAMMSMEGKKVLIVDTDNQGNVALSYGVNPDKFETTIYDVLIGEADLVDASLTIELSKEEPHYENLEIVVSNDAMSYFEFEVLTNLEKYKNPYGMLKKALLPIKDNFDYIFIDSPPNLGLTTSNTLSVADYVLIPFVPESYSVRSLQKMYKSINKFKEKHNPNLDTLGMVATMVNKNTTLHSEVLQQCRQFARSNNITFFDTYIPQSIRFASAIAYAKVPAVLTELDHKLVYTYFELLEEIKEKLEGVEVK